MYNACRTLKEWHDRTGKQFGMTINVSPIQIQAPDFVEGVFEMLDSLELSGEYLNIELTEGTVMEDPRDAIQKLNRLRERGIIHTIIAMSRNFNFTTVAEGVERQEQFQGLRDAGLQPLPGISLLTAPGCR